MEQVVIGVPALAVESVFIVSDLFDATEQLGFETVRVKIIFPDAISDALGV